MSWWPWADTQKYENQMLWPWPVSNPMAVRCPVCGGSGYYHDPAMEASNRAGGQVCHGCGGKGWVEVGR